MDEKNFVERKVPHDFTLDTFSKAQNKMIATSNRTYGTRESYWDRLSRCREYTDEEVQGIINSGSFLEQQALSRNFFNKEGYYKQIITHYATLLTYAGLLIPNPSVGKNLSTSHIQKKYYAALDYVERMQLPVFLTNCAIRTLVDGCYYGVVTEIEKNHFTTIDLPADYCRTRFKDYAGNDVIEFNLSYFDSISNEEAKKQALAAYPKAISKAYKEWDKRKRACEWFIIPSEISICFPMFDGRPPFLSIIPATLKYDEAVGLEQERNKEEIHKIIVQKIPHLTDGRLLFEPDEAEEIHRGSVEMLKGNKNLSVLTTYGDVDAITSKTSADNAEGTLSKMENNIYAQGATSSQIFNAEGSVGLEAGIRNNIAFMMIFANKAAGYITNVVNRKFSNSNVSFKYTILPISIHNYDKFVDSSFKLASSGYSFLMPALAMGLSQRDFGNLKDLENNVLKLGEKMIPPSSSYTQTSEKEADGESGEENKKSVETDVDEGGRPRKAEGEKSDETVRTAEARQ